MAENLSQGASPALPTPKPLDVARLVDIICFGLALGLVGFATWLVWRSTLARPEALRWSHWIYSEWLINYGAGFNRRGLAGAVLHAISPSGTSLPLLNTLAFTVFVLLAGLFVALFVLVAGVNRALLPLVLAPGSLLNMALAKEFFLRKEGLFHLALFGVALLILLWARTELPHRRVTLRWSIAGAALAAAVILPLVHEAYLFMGAPALALLLLLAARHDRRRFLAGVAGAVLTIALVEFGLASLLSGDPNVATGIFHSLSRESQVIVAGKSGDNGWLAIGAMSWTAGKALDLTAQLFRQGEAPYWLIPGATLALCLVAASRSLGSAARGWADPLAAWLLVFAAMLPMFVIGIDWGRWLSATMMGGTVVALVGRQLGGAPGPQRLTALLSRWHLPALWAGGLFALGVAAATFVAVPDCCLPAHANGGLAAWVGGALQLR